MMMSRVERIFQEFCIFCRTRGREEHEAMDPIMDFLFIPEFLN